VIHQGKMDAEYFKLTHSGFVEILKNHSLWVEQETDVVEGYKIPFGILPFEVEEKFELDMQQGKFPKTSKRKRAEDNVNDNSMIKRFQSFLRNINHHGSTPFAKIIVRTITVFKCKQGDVLTLYVKGEGAGNCLYSFRDHGEGRICFNYDVKSYKLYLHCFSEKYPECTLPWKEKDKRIWFTVDPWVYSGTDPRQLPQGSHNTEIVSLSARPIVFSTTQAVDPNISLSSLMRLTYENPRCCFKFAVPGKNSNV
jgi:hypothetical protein